MANQGESFFKLFKFLFEDPNFSDLKPNAKLMYALLTERNNLSVSQTENGSKQFIDEKGYIYSIYKNKELAEHLKCSEDTVTMLKRLLAKKQLLEEIFVGANSGNRLYPKKPYGEYLHQYDIDKYYEIPKSLFFNNRYKSLSTHAKITYALFLDRYKYSLYTKKYMDENQQIYCVLTNEQIAEKLDFSPRKVVNIKKELINSNLISQHKVGFKNSKRTYIFQPEPDIEMAPENLHVWHPEICTYGTRKSARMAPENLHPSDTDISDTDISDTDNNNLNNLHYLQTDTQQSNTSDTSNSSNSSKHVEEKIKDKELKDFTFNKYPERIRLELSKLDFEDGKKMMAITNKAKRAVAKEYDDMKKEAIDFSYETHEYEISSILCRMILKSKMDNLSIQSLSRYISRSIQNYYRDYADNEIKEMVERDMSSTDFDKFFKNIMEK